MGAPLFLVNCYCRCYYFIWLQLSRLDHSSSKRDETRVWIFELTSPNPYGVRLRSCYLWIFVEICLIILDISCPSYLLWYCFYVLYILSVVIFSLYFISYMVWYSFNAFIFQSIIFTYLITVFLYSSLEVWLVRILVYLALLLVIRCSLILLTSMAIHI